MKIKELLKGFLTRENIGYNLAFVAIAVLILIWIVFIINIVAENANAYTLNYAKAKEYTDIPKPLPNTITLNKLTITKINNCKANSGSVIYQAGFDDGCDYIRGLIGIAPKFKTRPALVQDMTEYYKIPIIKNYVDFNNSVNRFEFFDANHTLYRPFNIFGNKTTWINITYMRVYLR